MYYEIIIFNHDYVSFDSMYVFVVSLPPIY